MLFYDHGARKLAAGLAAALCCILLCARTCTEEEGNAEYCNIVKELSSSDIFVPNYIPVILIF